MTEEKAKILIDKINKNSGLSKLFHFEFYKLENETEITLFCIWLTFDSTDIRLLNMCKKEFKTKSVFITNNGKVAFTKWKI